MDAPILYKLPYGVFLITSGNNEDLGGCIINRVTQVTDLPVTIAASLSKDSHTAKLMFDTKRCILGFLSNKFDMDIITHFSSRSGNVENKFDIKYSDLFSYKMNNGIPFLDHHIVYNFICEIDEILDLDSHYLFILRVVDIMEIDTNDHILDYYSYKRKKEEIAVIKNAKEIERLENEPKHARTDFVCTVCSYVYKGEIVFEDLKDDYKCPICGANKDFFIEKYLDL